MGTWRDLGYVFSAFVIFGGFLLLISGFYAMSRSSYDTDYSGLNLTSNLTSQISGIAYTFGGLSGIMFGILLIWALVKSGQLENIDRNLKIIADWAKSQQSTASSNTKNETKEVDSDPDKEIT